MYLGEKLETSRKTLNDRGAKTLKTALETEGGRIPRKPIG